MAAHLGVGVPAEARDEWRALGAALERLGPTPCQKSSMPETWWLPELEETAVGICRGCSLAAWCLDYALAANEGGVWGATTADDRAAMHQRGESA